MSNQQEVVDGTNPCDAGSHIPLRPQTVCAPWNGFINIQNFFEHANSSSVDAQISSEMFRYPNEQIERFMPSEFTVASGNQADVAVHCNGDECFYDGWSEDAYGSVCSTISGDARGLRATMLQYKPDHEGAAGRYDFAVAIPAVAGRKGRQFVPFNTYQPSLLADDLDNPVANWAQVVNEQEDAQRGTIRIWNQDGSLADERRVRVEGRSRFDVGLHEVDTDEAIDGVVGFAEWIPDSLDASFKFDIIRYVYDTTERQANGQYFDSYSSAFFLKGLVGSNELLAAPYDSRRGYSVVEVSNVLDSSVNDEGVEENTTAITVIVSPNGTEETIEFNSFELAPKESRHIILLPEMERGMVTVQGSKAGSVIALVMHYELSDELAVDAIYGIPALAPLGMELVGSYNTFASQESELVVANVTDSMQEVNISTSLLDGTNVLTGMPLGIEGNAIGSLVLNQFHEDDTYGIVRVQVPQEHKFVAWMLRRHRDFVVPIQLTP